MPQIFPPAFQVFELSGEIFVGSQEITESNEGPDDQNVHLDGALAVDPEESMAMPGSVKAKGK